MMITPFPASMIFNSNWKWCSSKLRSFHCYLFLFSGCFFLSAFWLLFMMFCSISPSITINHPIEFIDGNDEWYWESEIWRRWDFWFLNLNFSNCFRGYARYIHWVYLSFVCWGSLKSGWLVWVLPPVCTSATMPWSKVCVLFYVFFFVPLPLFCCCADSYHDQTLWQP